MNKQCTVITPCYNPGRFLLPMLESVSSQGEVVARHVVMDGGSTDGTVERLAEWAKSHDNFVYRSEKDEGQSDACRKALELVETEYFYWLNADDLMLKGSVERLLGEIPEGEHPAIIYGDYVRIDAEGRVYARRRQPSFNYWDCLNGYITVQNAAAIFNTPMLRKAGGFDPSLRFVMDYDIILKLAKMGCVKHVRGFCGAFRVHEASKTMTIDDVCQRESDALRVKHGACKSAPLRWLLHKVAKTRVAVRMLVEGVALERALERFR